ncbi:anaerobic ribonucleoside-triphosphate reductase activating protein [Syntrophomonas erecta]
MIKFAGLIKQSLVDYPGEIAAVLFTRGCNIRCPFCHNSHLVIRSVRMPGEEIELPDVVEFLAERLGFLDAVVITGGEPTLHPELPEALRRFKDLGYLVKLDTNGTNSVMLDKLLQSGRLDYVAMDIKAPFNQQKYQQACGKLTTEEFCSIRNSAQLLMAADVQVEFRTTVVPVLHSAEDIENIARSIQGASLYTLQQFNPTATLDTGYMNVVPYSREEMQHMAELCSPYVQEVRVVNI